jgi:signal peptidase I
MGKKKSDEFQLTFDTAELPQGGDDLLDDIDRLLEQQKKKRQEGSAEDGGAAAKDARPEENGTAARPALFKENAQAGGAAEKRAQTEGAVEEIPAETDGNTGRQQVRAESVKDAREDARKRAAVRRTREIIAQEPEEAEQESAAKDDAMQKPEGDAEGKRPDGVKDAERDAEPEKAEGAAGSEEPQIQIDRNELLRKQRVAMFTKPEMLLETPYTVTVNNRQYVRYRLEYGNPDKEIPPEIASSAGILIPPIDRGDEQAAIKQRRKQKCANAGREIAGWVLTLAFAAVLALLINSFVFFFARVEGSSMLGTLKDGEVLFVWRAGYVFGQPQRGDIVICHYPKTKDGGYLDQKNTCYVKRVIGLPGDTVSIRQGTVYINGEALKESYLETERIDSQSMEAVVLEEGEYFLMGDNRSDSTDSRRMGAVERGKILGKAVGVVYPFTEFGSPYANTAG